MRRKTKKRHHKRETWWWNDEVNSAIAEKRRCWKAWKTAEEKKFSDLKPGMDDIFKIAKQLRKDNQDVVGDKCVKDDSVTSLLTTRPRKLLGNNTEQLLNEEFSWNPDDLTADPVVGPPIHVDVDGGESYHQDENWQSCWSLWNSSGNAEGIW